MAWRPSPVWRRPPACPPARSRRADGPARGRSTPAPTPPASPPAPAGSPSPTPPAPQPQPPPRLPRGEHYNPEGTLDRAVLAAEGLRFSLGEGRGGSAPPVDYDAGPDPTGLSFADVDRDGQLDLLVGNPFGD